jgi:hypothetical protein
MDNKKRCKTADNSRRKNAASQKNRAIEAAAFYISELLWAKNNHIITGNGSKKTSML